MATRDRSPKPRSSTSADIGRLLVAAGEMSKAAFAAAVADHDLTPQTARALFMLGEPASMRDLAEHLRCDASNVTGIADRLETAGWLERVPSAEDRRVKLLTLTDSGRELREELGRHVTATPYPADALTASERSELARLLTKLIDATPCPGHRGSRDAAAT
ncbi:MarR family transcriptional regulator [Knoellia sinensis KCTC 19936]|uniref:MarR family transcriptional regulator n=1 Tax=Knoellia sinensis KCTC 19936 TaxID=1385520 RepID=A0A0A0J6C7_9MICO|nr:MarR family transcriptional regulator [Knoellia sinensis]KGN32900.1 MarR family transcriptional regulator [Knoellia sinensis KCTC 19936]